MKQAMAGIITVVLLGASLGLLIPEAEAASTAPMRFGMQSHTINQQTAAGVKPDYGVFWVGPWNLKSGWGDANSRMSTMSSAGVTPAIHFYYWGDDISPSCVENGCWSSLHNSWKDKSGWQRLAQQTADNVNAQMRGKPVVILLETEFNKGGIERYEPFDGYLAAKAQFFKKNIPNSQVVLSFGNWNSGAWGVYDRAASASDYVGLQGMRGSTRDSWTSYHNLFEATLSGAKTAQSLFGKPVFITDIALSSYPEPNYLKPQADTLQKFFTGMPQLKAAGVKVLIYRAWADTPGMDLANYYGQAERHWGLTYAHSGNWKSSANVWVKGVKSERASGSGSSFTASFQPASSVNEWWVDVDVKSSKSIAKVDMQVNGGSWTALSKSSWGTWTKSTHVPKGSSVVFRATSTSWESTTSGTFQWLGPSTTTPAFTASFQPTSSINEWWVDVNVKGSKTVSKVDMKVNGGSWFALSKSSWGTWTKSTHVPKGSDVAFRATSNTGETATSATMTWIGKAEPAFTASFQPTSSVNEWWVDVDVKGSKTVSKVDMKVNGGSWFALSKSSWGTWTKSTHVPKGSDVAFRATSSTGETATSATMTWIGKAEPAFTASFQPTSSVNEWWVDVDVKGSKSVSKVDMKVNGGSWMSLSKSSWGTWTKSTHVPKGSDVVFRATSTTGETSTSRTMQWIGPSFSASFQPTSTGNDWWIDVKVKGTDAVSKVEVRVNGGSWTTLSKTDWGSYAKSVHAPNGSSVVFKATSSSGETATSGTFKW